ncbi:hypothetical protein DM01DRAFT_1403569 [Hesseltinella vesiculosa]|uniref:Uncharacterized protein n=1 Tax=Hesseltinella vesiculosa TaxID=101127 RepID=A0A1X2GYP4_9FUNG|nr:hypothetical protein DM01DRAFT_1403569 [Hesseltinella vesiculosa]
MAASSSFNHASTSSTYCHLPLTTHNLRLHQQDGPLKANRVLAYVQSQQENIQLENQLQTERQRQVDSLILLEKPSFPSDLIVLEEPTADDVSVEEDDSDHPDVITTYRQQKWQLVQNGLANGGGELSSVLFSSICTPSSSSSFSPSSMQSRQQRNKDSIITLESNSGAGLAPSLPERASASYFGPVQLFADPPPPPPPGYLARCKTWWARRPWHHQPNRPTLLSFRYPKMIPVDTLRDTAIHWLSLPGHPSSTA